MSIEAVIFDADGVLVFPDKFAEHLGGEFQITREATRAFFQGKFTDCLYGKEDLSAVLPPYLSEWGWKGTAEEFMQLWFSVEDAIDMRVLAQAEALREAGYVCCLASNQETYRAEYMRTVMGFAPRFDKLFFSCEIGWKKPNEQYYEHIETALGLKGDQIAFWDDSPHHIDAARERGWQAELYTTYEEFQGQAARLLETKNRKEQV